jgi:hypothetical protein
LYLPFNPATSPLSREDLIRACTVYEPTCSPGESVNHNDISYRVLQHLLRISEARVFTVTALLESAFPLGATVYRPLPVRLKLLSSGLASAGCLNSACIVRKLGARLFFSNITEKPIRYCVGSHWRRALRAHTRAHFSMLLTSYALLLLVPAMKELLLSPTSNHLQQRIFQREILKAMRDAANALPGARVRRVAISNSDPHGARTHWFTVCFEITNPFN